MNREYLFLIFAGFLPVLLSCFLYILEKKTIFSKLPYISKQIIIGLLFGTLAVLGNEWGININGAIVNARDAAVMSGGLLFGAPAGIIAGIIGGVERWFAVYWGAGMYTRIACSISTIIAGIYAALLRKYMFEDKKPSWILSLAIGVVMEVLHLTMVFITNLNDAANALHVVTDCSIPMITVNAISLMVSTIALRLLSGNSVFHRKRAVATISQNIQRSLLICVTVAMIITTGFMYQLQIGIANTQLETDLTLSIDDVVADIKKESEKSLVSIAQSVKSELDTRAEYNDNSDKLKLDDNSDFKLLSRKYDVEDINYISKEGIIIKAVDEDVIGYNMHANEQSMEIMEQMQNYNVYVQDYRPMSTDPETYRKYITLNYGDVYLQIGYDVEKFALNMQENLKGIADNRHIGETGLIMVFDSGKQLVSAPNDVLDFEELKADGILDISHIESGKYYEYQDYMIKFGSYESFSILAAISSEEAFRFCNIAVIVTVFLEVLVFAALFAMIFTLIRKKIVNSMRNVNESLAKITGGDLEVTVDVRTSEEFISLSDDINSTVDTLKKYIDAANSRIDKELEFARSIQSSALPSFFPAFPGRNEFDIYATMDTAKEVGGDFYDFYLLRKDKLIFLVADVSGKGIPAAMFMMRAKATLKSLTETGIPLDEVFTRANNDLCEGNDGGMFVTCWMASLDLITGELTYVNAGHNPPLLRSSDGRFKYLKSKPGLVLAGMSGLKYKTNTINMAPGDSIFLYTDGVTEATNINEELYSEDRLEKVLNSQNNLSCKEYCETVAFNIERFVGEADQFDDITMLSLNFYGKEKKPMFESNDVKIEDIPALTEFAESELEKHGCPMKAIMQINIAIDELYSNIAKFAYEGGTGKATVEFDFETEANAVTLIFTDYGTPYNPVIKKDPDITLSADDRAIGGLGIFMVKNIMDEMRYEYVDDKNILYITKKW